MKCQNNEDNTKVLMGLYSNLQVRVEHMASAVLAFWGCTEEAQKGTALSCDSIRENHKQMYHKLTSKAVWYLPTTELLFPHFTEESLHGKGLKWPPI